MEEPIPVPDTVFEGLTGLPAPRGDVTAEPLSLESVGAECDFCMTADSGPVVWAFPAGEANHSTDMGGFTFNIPVAAGLWYACERCRRYVKADRWGDLARDCGFSEGSSLRSWESFRVARLPGPGHAWPLVPHKLPTVHKRVRDAWESGKLAFAEHVRERLERAVLLLEIDGHLYVRCGEVGDDEWLAGAVGSAMVAPFSVHLGRTVQITLLPVQP